MAADGTVIDLRLTFDGEVSEDAQEQIVHLLADELLDVRKRESDGHGGTRPEIPERVDQAKLRSAYGVPHYLGAWGMGKAMIADVQRIDQEEDDG